MGEESAQPKNTTTTVASSGQKEPSLMSLIERALELEQIDDNLFRSSSAQLWKPLRARGVFGGQIIGLALSAATKTVPENFAVHSMHCYFLLAGNNLLPIVFEVTRVRDGRTFATRYVTAKQKGKAIYSMSCSFQIPETSPLNHQVKMPAVPPPEQLPNNEEVLKKWVANPKTHPRARGFFENRLLEPIPIEFKAVRQAHQKDVFWPPKMEEPKQMVWMRTKEKLPDSLGLAFHQCVAAYTSDHYLLNTSLLAHGVSGFTDPQLSMIASLDHAIWFHAPFRADDWLLYEMESTRTGNGRGLCLGRVYTRDGTLVMSCAQEGVIRAIANPKPLQPRPPSSSSDNKQAGEGKQNEKSKL